MNFHMIENAVQGTIIKVVGVGGAGGNAIQHMINKGVSGVEFIAINTDAQALAHVQADNCIQIGESGLGAGMNPEVARRQAEESRERIEDALRGAHMVFIAAGMGKGTGTGASPIVAEVAKSLGALTVAVVSKPFSYEGMHCMDLADSGLQALESHVDSLIVILNEKLEDMYEDASMVEWYQHTDDVLNNAVAGIAEIINVRGHVNVDFNDVKTIMGEQGKAMMGIGAASGIDRARIAAEQAVDSPLLDGVDLSSARGILVNITASRNLKGKEVKDIMATVRDSSMGAPCLHGIVFDDEMQENLRVTVVATGLGRINRKPILVQTPKLRTGTHDVPVQTEGVNMEPDLQAISNRFDDLERPAVWRNRSNSATDAVRAFEKSGMETYDIPAFLRKQAD